MDVQAGIDLEFSGVLSVRPPESAFNGLKGELLGGKGGGKGELLYLHIFVCFNRLPQICAEYFIN